MLYQRTLRSQRWKLLKWRKICQAGFRCEGCGGYYRGKAPKDAKRFFELHHLHYRTVGRESLDDVKLVCPDCHAALHEQRPRS